MEEEGKNLDKDSKKQQIKLSWIKKWKIIGLNVEMKKSVRLIDYTNLLIENKQVTILQA